MTPERAFAAWLDSFEEMPKRYPDRFLEAKVVSRSGDDLETTCTEMWGGRKMSYRMRIHLTAGRRIDEVVVAGDGKGTRATWAFDPAPGGARISVSLQPGGIEAMFGRLFRKRFEKELAEVVDLWVAHVGRPENPAR
jgi:hypothetical protein